MRGFLTACALCLLLGISAEAVAATTWNLSLPADVPERPGLESQRALFERTLAIELKDEQIVSRPGEEDGSAVLYVRVSYEGQNLRVEVWDRGDAAGDRLIGGNGGPGLIARRVALTTVELVRKLSLRRSADRRRELEAEARARAEEERSRRQKEKERPRLAAALLGVGFPSAGAVVGPELGLRLNGDHPLRFGVSLSYGAGFLTALPGVPDSGSPTCSLLSVELSSAYAFSISSRAEFSLGPYVRASALHVGGPAFIASNPEQADELIAQAGLFAQIEPAMTRSLGVFFRADAGIILSPVPLSTTDATTRLEGLGLGVALGTTLGL